jgi:hypothetical protein
MPSSDDRTVVTTVDETPAVPARVGTAQLLEAIRDIPSAVAAQVRGGGSTPMAGGRPEVTFVAEALPEPEPDSDEPDSDDPVAAPDPLVERPRWRHPSRRRRRAEALT